MPSQPVAATSRVRFEGFGFEPETLELFRDEAPVAIQQQPARMLRLLLERPGRLVTREAIQDTLWATRHAAYADGINTCVKQLRATLGDATRPPRIIQTVPRQGYRFVAKIEATDDPGDRPPQAAPLRTRVAVCGTLATCLGALLLTLGWSRPQPTTLIIQPFALQSLTSSGSEPSGLAEGLLKTELEKGSPRWLRIVEAGVERTGVASRAASATVVLAGKASVVDGEVRLDVSVRREGDLGQQWDVSYAARHEDWRVALDALIHRMAESLVDEILPRYRSGQALDLDLPVVEFDERVTS